MSEGAGPPNVEGNGGIEFDEVFIDGKGYKVPVAVANEIVNVRRGSVHEILDRIKTMNPEEDDTVVVTVPAKVSQEFQMQAGQLTTQSFPDNRIAVLPEGLDMHTQKGLHEMVTRAMEVATAVQDNNPERARVKADEFVNFVSGRGEETG